jgi:hypothetical protein
VETDAEGEAASVWPRNRDTCFAFQPLRKSVDAAVWRNVVTDPSLGS